MPVVQMARPADGFTGVDFQFHYTGEAVYERTGDEFIHSQKQLLWSKDKKMFIHRTNHRVVSYRRRTAGRVVHSKMDHW